MKEYTIPVDETVSKFFEELARVSNKPVEEVMGDALYKRAESCIAEIFKVLKIDMRS